MRSRHPWLILLGILVAGVLLYFNFTRQLIKMTALFSLPVIMLYLLGSRLKRKSIGRTIIAAFMLLIVVIYGIQLFKLPSKAQVWRLSEEGAALVAAEKYDEARSIYKQMGELGYDRTMQKKLDQLAVQQQYSVQLIKARKLAKQGKGPEAIAIIKDIPITAGCYPEARKLQKELKDQEN